ncbi:hypothetical protein A3A09_03155 [Candidatus Nomurabacteria bacterium RIFCSPLOWO2_01_FULL_42_20]|uniref:Uncharacterized protein n=1 Tax=Candidatus Nomurabacteria bacterium RIFCSPHIGHO2_01_FULL_42_16 TaxID=1801743 RepID=A0A1F6VJH3_9BACT|nr:MAG: hypothetical protein A2824_03255 [Candidatus Nomurabacteria bacterium RIFCSPHIGHO2_01_FULL_42_16]OGI92603.1 MAG: hypothetical protein A3A09_03155 [Candidatus Nomurabacteria bacterium RIFCSPLOWO2_01_FULL_42_20]
MENEIKWPIQYGGKQLSENEVRNFVEKQKAMLAALEDIRKFTETGELPVVNGKEKTAKDLLVGLDNWDKYCEQEFSNERKKEMQQELNDLRAKVESKLIK